MRKEIISIVITFFLLIGTAVSAVTLMPVQQGGTGAGTFTSGQVLMGNGIAPLTSMSTSEWDAAYTHISSNGSDHTFIDQSVVIGASPTFLTPSISGLVWDNITLATSSDILNLWNIDTLANVSNTGLASGDTFHYDGTNWVSSSTPYVDTNTGYVGIGTTAPAYLLDVGGTTQTHTLRVNTLQSDHDNSIYMQPTGDTDDFFTFKSPEDRPTLKREGGKFIYIDSSNVYDMGLSMREDDTYSGTLQYEKDTHRIGLIGKAVPIFMKANSDYDDFILFQTSNNLPEITVASSTGLKINAGGTNNLLLNDGGGYVGIGTATPVYALDVYGDARVSGTTTTTRLTVKTSSKLGTIISGVWNGTAIDFSDYVNAIADTGIKFTGDAIGFDCSEVEGDGINCVGELITLDNTGDWSGTFDGQEGSWYTTASNINMLELSTATYNNSQSWSNTTQSAGVTSGGIITDSGSGEVDISSVTGIIKSTNSVIGENYNFDLAGVTNYKMIDETTTFISIDYNGGTPQFATSSTNIANGHTIFNLGKVFREGTGLDIIDSGLNIYDFSKRVQQHHIEEASLHFTSGAVIGEVSTRYISVTAGVMYAGLNRIITDAVDTSGADTFEYYYYDGAWQESDASQIDNIQYNNYGTGLEALTANRYGVHWVYKGTNATTYVVYGVGDYTLAQAQLSKQPSSLPEHVSGFGVLRARIIIKKSDSLFTEIDQVADVEFQASSPVNHNDLGALQGGAADEYYHLTSSEYSVIGSISGTNTGDVTLAGTPDYITISGQVITRNQIDLANDVTGELPFDSISNIFDDPTFTASSSLLLSTGTTTIPLGVSIIAEEWDTAYCFTTAGIAKVRCGNGTSWSSTWGVTTATSSVNINFNFGEGNKRFCEAGNQTVSSNDGWLTCTFKQIW